MIYELHTRAWLQELSDRLGSPVTLDRVPDPELDAWARLGFSHLWLMGVWRTGPRALEQCRSSRALAQEAAQLLPAYGDAALVASPYAIAGYEVHPDFGGDAALARFRHRLAGRGLKLLLDFIPNHTGLDHPWLWEQPDFYVPGRAHDDDSFLHDTSAGPRWIAHGRDPHFPPWRDTAQLDFRSPALRAALIESLRSIAGRCDGVRADMAMLCLNERFAHHWQTHPRGSMPVTEFWSEAMDAIRTVAPAFEWVAEVYWGCEARLQALGFHFTYDKELYDHLVAHRPEAAWRHAYERPIAYAMRSVHFLENHDEPRIASVLPWAEHRMAAVLLLGLPGLPLVQDGQLTGATRRAPIQLARHPAQPPQPEIAAFYERLLACRRASAIGRGQPVFLRASAIAPATVAPAVVLVQWTASGAAFDLVAVNLTPEPVQCRAPVDIGEGRARPWHCAGRLGSSSRVEPPGALAARGLLLELPPFAAEIYDCRAVGSNLGPGEPSR